MKITIKLSEQLYDELELLTPEGQKVETFIEKRLSLLAKINPDRPWMYLNGDAIEALNALYGGHVFKDSKDLIETLRRTQSFRLKPEEMDITLDMDIITQLKNQAEGMGVPFSKYMRDNVNEALMFLVGCPIVGVTVPGQKI